MQQFDAERLKLLSAGDAELVRDCELEAQDAENIGKYLDSLVREGVYKKGPHGGYELVPGQSRAEDSGVESLCSLGRDHDYTPWSDDMEDNILYRLATSAIDNNERRNRYDCPFPIYQDRIEHIFGGVSQYDCALSEYRGRVEEIFGSVSKHALNFFEEQIIL